MSEFWTQFCNIKYELYLQYFILRNSVKNNKQQMFNLKIMFIDNKIDITELLQMLAFYIRYINSIMYLQFNNLFQIQIMFEEEYNFNDSVSFQHINLKQHVQPSFPHLASLKRKNQEKFSQQKLNTFIDIDRQAQTIQLVNISPDSLQLQLTEQAKELLKTYSAHNLAFIGIIGTKGSGKSFLIDRMLNLAGVKGNHFNEKKKPGIYAFNNPFILENQVRVFFLQLVYSNMNSIPQNQIIAEIEALLKAFLLICSSILILEDINKSLNSFSFSEIQKMLEKASEDIVMHDYKAVSKYSGILPQHGWYLYRQSPPFTEKNTIFNDIRSFLIPDAMNPFYKGSKQDLTTVSYLCKDVVNQNYVRKVSELFKILSKQTRQKKQNGLVYNGNIVLKLLQHLIKKINHNQVIYWDTMLKEVLQELYQSAYQYCVIIYDDFLQKELSDENSKDIDQLLLIFQNASQNVLSRYNQYSLDPILHEQYQQKLLQYITLQQQNVIVVNNQKSKLKYIRMAHSMNLEQHKHIQKTLNQIKQKGQKNEGAAIGLGQLLSEVYQMLGKGINSIDQKQFTKINSLQHQKQKITNQLKELKKISATKQKEYSELQNQMKHLQDQCKDRDKQIAHFKHEIQCAKKIESEKDIGAAQRLVEQLKKEIKNNDEIIKKLKAQNVDEAIRQLSANKRDEINKIKQKQVAIMDKINQIQGKGGKKPQKKSDPTPITDKPKPVKQKPKGDLNDSKVKKSSKK